MSWSRYQNAVFDFATNGKGHGTVEAVAGSGKTTTGMELITRLDGRGLFSSFTRTIVDDLSARIKEKNLPNVAAMTYNTFGNKIVRSNSILQPKLLSDYNGQKTDVILKYDVLQESNEADVKFYYDCKNTIIRCVSLFKNLAILSVDEAASRFNDIVDYYDIEIPKNDRFLQVLLDVYRVSLLREDIMDFDDQKFLPILRGYKIPQHDFVIIDEYQDTCPIESELMLRAADKGRIIIFGDSYQAIYSFKGTAPDSMSMFTEKFSALRLPLSICYRCPRAVVEEAKKIVPHIEASPTAIEGVVDGIKKEKYLDLVTPNDMVLGRTTDTLVKSVTQLIGKGRAAYVEGRDYGNMLVGYVQAYGQYTPMKEAMDKITADYHKRSAELLQYNKENLALALEAKYETVSTLVPGCQTVADLIKKIQSIFTDNGKGIRHLTIHKSKGLEGSRDGDVYILRPDMIPHPRAKQARQKEEEQRLKYVGITRTKRGLFWVEKGRDEK